MDSKRAIPRNSLGIDSMPRSLAICRNRSPWCLPARAILPTLMLNFPIARAILPARVLDSVLSSIASSPPPQPLSHRGDHRPDLHDSVPSRPSPPPLPFCCRRRPINRRSCCLLPLGIGLFLFVVMSQHPHGEIPPYVRRGDPNCAALYSLPIALASGGWEEQDSPVLPWLENATQASQQ